MNEEVINIFNLEKELYETCPKKLLRYFNDYWDSFLNFADQHNLTIQTVVKKVNKNYMQN